jgi:ParB/RepB/Spo0J family partition protein
MIRLNISDLKPHSKNDKYFSSIEGYEFEELKESIKRNGLIEPLIVKKDDEAKYVIICGNQRYKACKELGIKEVDCIVKEFKTEEDEIQVLIEDNLHRRHLSPSQRAKLLVQLSKIVNKKTKKEVLEEIKKRTQFGERQAQKYLNIGEKLIPEFNDFLDKNIITINIANAIANHSEEVQREIYIESIKQVDNERKSKIEKLLEEKNALINICKKKDEELKEAKNEIVEIKSFLSLKGINYSADENDTEIVKDIISINSSILGLVKKIVEKNQSLKKFALTKKDNEKLKATFLSKVKPPLFPIFTIDIDNIMDFIEFSDDEEKLKEIYQEQALKYLE